MRERPALFTCGKRRTRRRMDNARQDGEKRPDKLRRIGEKPVLYAVRGAWCEPIRTRESMTPQPAHHRIFFDSLGGWGAMRPADPRKASAERLTPFTVPAPRNGGAISWAGPRFLTHQKGARPRPPVWSGILLAYKVIQTGTAAARITPKKNLCVNTRGARRNLRPPFVCSSRAPGPCRPRTNRRFPPPVRCAAKCPPAANAPTDAKKRPTIPNWNSVKKKILDLLCKSVYICVCGYNSAPAKRKAGLL